jgi:hypothetical protein
MSKENPKLETKSMRISEETNDKLKELSELFGNKEQALIELIRLYEFDKAKSILPDRKTEIDEFNTNANKIIELYSHSLLLLEGT